MNMKGIRSLLATKSTKESFNEFDRLDVDGSNSACKDEIAAWVASNAEMWAMLSVNLGIREEKCRETATRVAMELATGKQGEEAMKSEINRNQFHKFRTKYILDPKGSQEFFHRSVFATFDADGNSYLDTDELEDFLDTFYKTDSIFKGDMRLPEKHVLKQLILDKHDTKRDRRLSFDSIRGVISGHSVHDLVAQSAIESANQEKDRKKDEKTTNNDSGLLRGWGGKNIVDT